MLWHERMGHVNVKSVLHTAKLFKVNESALKCDKDFFCEICVISKQTRKPHVSLAHRGDFRRGEKIHTDVVGPRLTMNHRAGQDISLYSKTNVLDTVMFTFYAINLKLYLSLKNLKLLFLRKPLIKSKYFVQTMAQSINVMNFIRLLKNTELYKNFGHGYEKRTPQITCLTASASSRLLITCGLRHSLFSWPSTVIYYFSVASTSRMEQPGTSARGKRVPTRRHVQDVRTYVFDHYTL